MKAWYTCRQCGKVIRLETSRNGEDRDLFLNGGWAYIGYGNEGRYICGRCLREGYPDAARKLNKKYGREE